METLIELYDERPLENVLGVELFRPLRVVYICPARVTRDQAAQRRLREYFAHRGQAVELEFVKADVYRADAILKTLRAVVARWPDCAIDVTGGTDAVIYAAGLLGAERPLPAFTYSRRKNRFYEIRGAAFANRPCDLVYSVEDCFRMAGGELRPGRVDNAVLGAYEADIQPFFRVFQAHRRAWVRLIGYLQRLSYAEADPPPLCVRGPYCVKGDRGAQLEAPEEALRALGRIGFLQQLCLSREEGVSFRFRDRQIRAWLRDVGIVLELYVWQLCRQSGFFSEVRLSAVVDWEQNGRDTPVSNELDVMCTRGVTPVFISCKTGEIKTEALNELAVLRDRFGGGIARAAVISAERGSALMRTRAAELQIQVVDQEDLPAPRLRRRLRKMLGL